MEILARVRKFPFLPVFFLFCQLAIFCLPFSFVENCGIFLFVAAIVAVNILPYVSLELPEIYTVDTVSNSKIPFYCMGNFIGYLEI